MTWRGCCTRRACFLLLGSITISSRLLVITLLALTALPACDTDPVSVDEPVSLLPFKAPMRYVVRHGDTLAMIALSHGVSQKELQAWNGIDKPDLIEVGKTLLIWELPEVEEAPAAPTRKAGRARVASRKSRRAIRPAKPPVTIAAAAPVVVVARPAPRPTVMNAGILGGLGEALGGSGLDGNLLAGVAGLSRTGTESTGSGLDRRGNMGGTGSVGSLDGDALQVRRQASPKTGVAHGTVRAPRLARPAPKRCLAGPSGSESIGEDEMIASNGLSSGQVQGAMRGFLRKTSACIPAGSSGTVTVHADIVVGCDGRVKAADVTGPVPDNVAGCIATTLGYAGFPAHDMPTGFSFRYPITYQL